MKTEKCKLFVGASADVPVPVIKVHLSTDEILDGRAGIVVGVQHFSIACVKLTVPARFGHYD